MTGEPEILGESLPFDEIVHLESWRGERVDPDAYRRAHSTSVRDSLSMWESLAKELDWQRPWTSVLSDGDHPNVAKWFAGGALNLSQLALDRHVAGPRRNKLALIWEGEPVGKDGNPAEVRKYTYYDLWREVNRLAFLLRNNFGMKKGDRMAVYMPLVPEAIIFLLAAARLGVTFTVVFSGFSAEALASRISDLGAKLLVTADGLNRRGKQVGLKEIADGALEQARTVNQVIVVRRTGAPDTPMKAGRDYWFDDLMRGVPSSARVAPEPLESEHPLYVLYTSGTTGKPKGLIHDNGGYAVLLHATMKWAFDINDGDVYWCPADIGWVTGHSYVVFGPLIEGATEVVYEGTLDFPQPDRWWRVIERYGVSVFYTTPTATRMQMRFGEDFVRKHDRSSLRLIHSVGEPINPSAWRWLFEVVGERRCPVGSTWWMTETGGIMVSHLPGLKLLPMKPGTNGLPIPGVDADVVDEGGQPVGPGEKGLLVIRNRWPGMPGPPTGMWGDPERYAKQYFERFSAKGYFYCGDYAVKDKDGYIWVAGRADEVLKVAGHRIGTFELESSIVSHKAASEAAVVAIPDPVKGEVPIAFVVLREGFAPSEELRKEVRLWVRNGFSPIAEPTQVYFVNRLPKTRSGKIMRRLVKAVAEGKPLGDVATLEDEASVDEVKQAYRGLKVT
ncbi:MAG: acetate--CoA ligase [Nitrososphaerota archaeon]|nr:acetate--CoA ligase [Nitrososphaerota archaeon]